jgi:hypothetical protein
MSGMDHYAYVKPCVKIVFQKKEYRIDLGFCGTIFSHMQDPVIDSIHAFGRDRMATWCLWHGHTLVIVLSASGGHHSK